MNWYLSPTGNDTTGDGSKTNPFKTLSHTISYVNSNGSNGDIIILLDGEYPDDAGVKIPIEKSITIKAENLLGAKLHAPVLSPHYISYLYIFNLKIVASTDLTSPWDGFIWFDNTLPDTTKNIVITIDKCYLYETQANYLQVINFMNYSQEPSERNQIFKLYNSVVRGAKNLYSAGHPQTIIVIKNSILSDISEFYDCGRIFESYNCYYNVDLGFQIDKTSMIKNPDFINPLYSDNGYLISSSSPCINKGTIILNYRETYYGTAPDIGILDYGSGNQITLWEDHNWQRIYFNNVPIGDYAWATIDFFNSVKLSTIPRLVGDKVSTNSMGIGTLTISIHSWVIKSSREELERYFLFFPTKLGVGEHTLKIGDREIPNCFITDFSIDSGHYHNWAFFTVTFKTNFQKSC